jgi:hypothetical protein
MKTFSQADKTTLAALHRVTAPEMQPLKLFFENLLADTKDALVTATPDIVPRLQGRAGVLREFLDAVNSAASTLEKMR